MKGCRFIAIFVLQVFSAAAQDMQFTQFYATPLFLNPAFTGLTYEHRFTAAYRNQWPGVSKAYSSYLASYDYNISDLHSGIGLIVMQDKAGTPGLVTTRGGINYAYSAKVNRISELRGGLSVALAQKRIDITTLVFNDQLVTGATVSRDALNIQTITFADVSAGALFNSTNYWIGFSASHINQPNVSMTGENVATPVYSNLHGGYRYIIAAHGAGRSKLDEFVSASFQYRHQGNYDQLDVGAYYYRSHINLGVWYRGLPVKSYKPGYPTRESLALLVGFELPDKGFRVGYSYDITLSQAGLNNTLGAHEVSLVYEVAKKRKRNRRVLVSCPKF